ncbi:MAG TPA: cyclic nucleotide-binding domain-containing protein [Ghiorsea sp.]|nr:cyclic nucleotide-binding domain-containing protein [Ghiorsea sp.]HIP06595.1 cyclic nucleotide-binding domain-containing protein [Mariprofundaceae bacterium]
MITKVTKKKLEQSLETYASLVEAYPDNEDFLQQYADMLQSLGREATATITLQHLHDVIAKRSAKEAKEFAKKHPQIGRISLEEIFDTQDKHSIAGQIIFELLGKIWLRLHQKKLKEGQVVCRSDEQSDSLILVLKGSVDMYALDVHSNRILLENVGVNDILGEHTFFKPSTMNIDAYVSSESAIIIKVPRKKLVDMIDNNEYLKNMLNQRHVFRYLVRSIALHPIFKTLPLKLSKYLARYVVRKKFPEKSMIFTLSDDVDGIYILLSGKASYLAKNKQGKKFALSPLQPNSLAGDLLLKGANKGLTNELYATNEVHTLLMPREQLLNISAAFPPLIERLTQHAEYQQHQISLSLTKLNHD